MRPLPPPSLPPTRSGMSSIQPDSGEADIDALTRLPAGFAPDTAIDDQIEDLERWALVNLRQDRNERIRFWVLRGVALLGSAGAAVAAGLAASRLSVGLGVAAALAVAVDSAWPPSFRSPALRAVHDLRELQNTLKLRWDKVRLAHPDLTAPQRVAHAMAMLDAVLAKREEIGKYLVRAEPSTGVKR
ncbi:MAG TPA: hypothetical protein VGK73_04860 [Polyangiaceae bacterium]